MSSSLSIIYSVPLSEDSSNEPFCVVEQIPFETEEASLEKAAALLDAAFEVDPCTDKPLTVDPNTGEIIPALNEEEFFEKASEIAVSNACIYSENYKALVKIYISDSSIAHKSVFQDDDIEILSETLKNSIEQYTIDIKAPTTVNLEYPLHSEVRIFGYPYPVKRDGQKLIFDNKFHGTIEVVYASKYYLQEVQVPCDIVNNDMPSPMMVVFYDKKGYNINVDPPIIDKSNLEDGSLADCLEDTIIGSKNEHEGVDTEDSPSDWCTKSVRKYNKCSCSKDMTNLHYEDIRVPCDVLGTVDYDQFEGYVTCPGEKEELSTPEYYEEKCCEAVPSNRSLPLCKEIYSSYYGDAPIEDKQRLIDIYGEDRVFFIPVPAADGICGEHIVKWIIDAEDCCGDATSMSWSETHTDLKWNETYNFCVSGGVPPFTWSTEGSGLSIQSTFDSCAKIKVNDCFCAPGQVIVTDACDQQISHGVTSEEGAWVAITAAEWGGPETPLEANTATEAPRDATWQNEKWKIVQYWETGWASAGCQGPRTRCDGPNPETVRVYPPLSLGASELLSPNDLNYINNEVFWGQTGRHNSCPATDLVGEHFETCDPGKIDGYRSIQPEDETYSSNTKYFKWDCGKWTELLYDNENSADVIAQNSNAMIKWQGGKAPFWVELSGQGFFLDASFQLQAFQFSGNTAKIYTGESCGYCDITITDSCGNIVAGEIHSEGEWKKLGYEILKAYDLVPDIVAEYNLYNCVSRYIHAKITWPSTYGRYGFNNVDAYTEPSGSVEVATHYQGAGLEDGNCRTTSLATQSVWATFYGATVKIPLNTEFFWSDYYERWAGYFLQDAFYFFEFTCPE